MSAREDEDGIAIEAQYSGARPLGLGRSQVFELFYSTKPGRDGLGLYIQPCLRRAQRRLASLGAAFRRHLRGRHPAGGFPMTVHTDGGCLGNPGPGAWAYVAETAGGQVADSGFDGATTNNRMELMAVIEALKLARGQSDLQADAEVVVVTDSRYVEGGIVEWIPRWQANGWMTKARSPVKNRDLWQQLLSLKEGLQARGLRVEFRRVRGHAGVELNEACHCLVTERIAAGPAAV